MQYDPRSEPHNLAHSPLTALVVPRPIGWISTIGPGGIVNLAPYSFFNMVSAYPPFLIFSGGPRKHTEINAETNKEFVFNLATYELKDQMNTSASWTSEQPRVRERMIYWVRLQMMNGRSARIE